LTAKRAAAKRNVVDSSAWLEYFADGPNAPYFAPAVEDVPRLVVPAIVLYEVFKVVLRERGKHEALEKIAAMRRGRVVAFDADLALAAADISLSLRLPLADSVILATARAHGAVVWTQDSDFESIPDARYRANSDR
jgi:predicted nucleic acid-binding protein